MMNRFFVNNANVSQQGLLFLDQTGAAANPYQQLAAGAGGPADLTKKIDDLTAQVQALTKAVESLKASQGEKK